VTWKGDSVPYILSKVFRFEAAHFLPAVPAGHPCRRLHGHSYRIEVSVRGEMHATTGWVLDYGDLSRMVRPALEPLDHNLLNAVPGLENPTSERLADWLWRKLAPLVAGLYRITVLETCQTRCEYLGPAEDTEEGRDRDR
jgi:6-pyruvoyltetrahydropterin/6-carboxytetrahydropterin synthase